MPALDFVNNLEKPTPDFDQMAHLESEFKAAVKTAKENEMNPPSTLLDNRVADTLRQGMSNGVQSFSQGMQSGMQTMQPAVMSMKATAQTLRDKLVSTAEDLLRTQSNNDRVEITSRPATSNNNSAMTYSANATSGARPTNNPAPVMSPESKRTHVVGGDAIGTRNSSPEIKRVIFPKIER
jgi:flagellar hook-basal body complex protein FliE